MDRERTATEPGQQRPWLWLAILVLAATLATWAVAGSARGQIGRNQEALEAQAHLALQATASKLSDYFSAAAELARVGAGQFSGVHDDLPLAQRLAKGLFAGSRSPFVYGAGVFYAPYRFSRRARLMGVYYEHAPRGGFMHYVTADADYFLVDAYGRVTYNRNEPGVADYVSSGWFLAAKSRRGVVVYGPYREDGKSFITVERAFTRDGRFAGVVTVDTLTPRFRAMLESGLRGGEIGYVISGGGSTVVATGALPRDRSAWIERSATLPYTAARLYVLVSRAAVARANRSVISWAIGWTLCIWVVALLLAFAFRRTWRARRQARLLEVARTRLESELAIGKEVESELRRIAETDALTGLPNRAAFLEKAATLLEGPDAERKHAVIFIDLDRFNMINDTLGHLTGDELLRRIATRLRDEVCDDAGIYRLGGDEFVVLTPLRESAGTLVERLLVALHEPILLEGRVLHTGASAGVVMVDAAYHRPDDLLRDADIAMYAAKERGRAQYAIFDAEMRDRVASNAVLESDLRLAIERREFVPYYQPIVSVATEEIVSFEALVRWNHPGRGVVGAAEFVPYAESHGFIDEIDRTTMQTVLRDAACLAERYHGAGVAVNVSARRLTHTNLVEDICALLQHNAVSSTKLRIEVTETAVMTNAEQGRATLERLRAEGLQIVLDDFGSGYSSLAYLHRLPIVGLKIDNSFIASLTTDANAVAIVRSVVALAGTLGLYTVAEGIETGEQLSFVRSLGVQFAQGFFFSRALPLDVLLQSSPLPTRLGAYP